MAGLNAFYYCVERCAWLIVRKLWHIFLCLSYGILSLDLFLGITDRIVDERQLVVCQLERFL